MAWISNWSVKPRWRSCVLMTASFLLLAVLEKQPVLLLPLLGFLALGYAGLVLMRSGGARFLGWAVFVIVLAYAWLKKYTFLPPASLLGFSYFTLGISYIFFRILHLLIETAERPELYPVGPGEFLLYMLNFTTLVSGPIQRYEEFAREQFAEHPPALGSQVIGAQIERIVLGLFKVNVLAMLLHMAQLDALAQLAEPLSADARIWAAMKLCAIYPFFLYANFSGYIDIVIALARLMHLKLPENFDRPFSASSFLDFWNRWHITLSVWLRTYVYNPLLLFLMRRFSSPAIQSSLGVVCFFVTFFLVGLWHGRTMEFIIFGALQGGGVAANKLWQNFLTRALGRKGYKDVSGRRWYVALGRGLTFSWFAFSLFWFWATSSELTVIAGAIHVAQWFGVWVAMIGASAVLLSVWESLHGKLLASGTRGAWLLSNPYVRTMNAATLGLLAFVLTVLLSQPAPDIVYKAF